MLAVALLFATVAAKAAPLDHAACLRALEPPKISAPADLARARRLDTRAIRALLVGHTLVDPSRAPPVIYDIAYLEWFRADGVTWSQDGGRGGGDSGTYAIKDGQVCVVGRAPRHCRSMWVTPRGRYFTVETQSGGRMVVQAVSIEAGLAPQDGPRPQPVC